MTLSIGIVLTVQWIGLSIIAGVIAQHKGRFGPGFGVLSLLLSPVVGLLVAYVVAPNFRVLEAQQLVLQPHKRCTACGELLRPEVTRCEQCGSEALSLSPASTPLGRTAVGSPPPKAFWGVITGE